MLNTRLDAEAIAFMLDHGEARVLLTDTEFAPTMKAALELTRRELIVIDVDDSEGPGGERLGETDYESVLATGDTGYRGTRQTDEWDGITLNYTSATNGDPRGGVYHHRGAYLNSPHHVLVWAMPMNRVYLLHLRRIYD